MRLNNMWIVAGLMTFGLLFTGCIFDDEGSTAPTTDSFGIVGVNAGAEVQLNTTYNLKGKVKADKGISTIALDLVPSGGGDAISLTVQSGYSGKKSWDLEDAGQSFVIPAGTSSGNYSVRITVTDADGNSGSQTVSVTVVGVTGDPITERGPVTMGAQDANPGSFLDLDNFQVYTMGTAPAVAANIDIVFAYSESQGNAAIYSPDAAANGVDGGSGFTFVQTTLGASARTTTIKSITQAEYDNASTTADLSALWSSATAVGNGRLTVSTSSAFIAQSSGGKLVAVKVTGLVNATTGTITLVGEAMF